MRAYVLRSPRQPYEEADVDIPRPGPGRALVRVRAAAICYRDYLAWQGWQRVRTPVVPGHEFAGDVVEVGEGVDGLAPGDKVAGLVYEYCGECEQCRIGRPYLCRSRRVFGEDLDGAFAEYVSVDVKSLVKLPPGIGYEAASFAACVVATVVRGLEKAGVSPGSTVLVTGASGGIGIHALQVARAYGAKAVAVTRPEKEQHVSRYADVTVTTPEFSEEVRKMGGADIVVESVGRPTIGQSIRSLKWGGRLVLIGNVDPASTEVQLGLLILREIDVLPAIHAGPRDLEKALSLMAEGKVRPVYATYRFEEIPSLVEATPRGGHVGRRVAVP